MVSAEEGWWGVTDDDADLYELRRVQLSLIGLVEAARGCLSKIEDVLANPRWGPVVSVSELYDKTPIEELYLSVRAERGLKYDGVRTVSDLVCKSDQELLRTPNFGKKSLSEVKAQLEAHRQRLAEAAAGRAAS